MAERDRRFSPVVLAGDALLLLCALCGLTGSLLSLYGDPDAPWAGATVLDRCAANGDILLLWAAAMALCGLAVWSLPRFRGAAAGALAALWALALWPNWEGVSSGAILTCKTIADQFSSRVDWGRTFSYGTGLLPAQDAGRTQLFLLFALALLALVLGWAVVRARRWWLALVLTLPPLLPGLVADLYPSWPAFMALAACWCVMLLTDLCKWAAPSSRGRLTLAVLPAVAAALVFITLAFPQDGYTRPPWALKAQEALTNLTSRTEGFFSRWDGPFRRTVTYVGSAEEADLAHAGPLGYSGRTVLRVTSDYAGRLYLRGSSLAVYEDGVWKALPDGVYEEYGPDGSPAVFPLYFPAMLSQDGPTHTITVDNVGAVGACVYAPYFPVPQVVEDTGAMPVEDAYLARRQGQWSHTLSFVERDLSTGGSYFALTGGIYAAGSWSADQAKYGSFACAHYLDVPTELRETLDEMIGRALAYPAALTETDAMNYQIEYAHRVAAWMEASFEYDPETPAAPEGTDPVLYFLNESHRGYCMHFASAAALMLREMGVPARYVSGFTVESVPDKHVDVPDRAAHAWVEVWVDGFGWYPVEVTPAAAFTWYEQGAAIPDDLPSEAPESQAPEPTPTPSQPPDAEASQQPSDGPQSTGGNAPESGGNGLAVIAGAAKVLAVIAGLCALIWLGQFVPKRHRAKKLSSRDRNRAALDAYGYLRRMERWGGRMDERVVELAQKARFSQHTLTQEELDELRGFVDRERERLCIILGPAARLAFRYVWGMPPRPKKGENTENSPEKGG